MPIYSKMKQAGLTLIELMIAMAIGLVVMVVTTYIYVRTNESQKAMDRQSAVSETGVFVIQALGRDIKMAGFYPATALPITSGTLVNSGAAAKDNFMASTQANMYETYPPLKATPQLVSDWVAPTAAYEATIFGCDGANFDTQNGVCPAGGGPNLPDSLVINWFTSDAMGDNKGIGYRKDCNGADIANDAVNSDRRNDAITGTYDGSLTQPPKLPIFGSNRYGLISANNYIDGNKLTTYSFGCSGNGTYSQGVIGKYQGSVLGLVDMQIEYGVYSNDASLSPAKFYNATEVSAMPQVAILGQSYTGWQRVTAVKVCIISRSVGDKARIATSSSEAPTYLDCKDQSQPMPSGQWLKRDTQIFGVRNNLKQSY